MTLRDRHCVPCRAGERPLAAADLAGTVARDLPGWRIEGKALRREFRFPDFVSAMDFINRMAALAEAENHHPDFAVHYDRVEVSLWTHTIDGLSENDLILAAKIDAL